MNYCRTLFVEFAEFYRRERCRWAPVNPCRAFNLAFRTLYPYYRRFMTPEQFMSEVYATLGTATGSPRGLFQTFSPSKYHGRLAVEDHFLNFFKRKLWGKLHRSLKVPSDRGRRGDKMKFRGPKQARHSSHRLDLLEPEQPCRHHLALVESLVEAVSLLERLEQDIVRLVYESGLSDRSIAAELRIDRGTVGRKHRKALAKLRHLLGAAA